MNVFKTLLIVLLMCSCELAFSQSTVYFRNSTGLTYDIEVLQSGTHTMQLTEWTLLANKQDAWEFDQAIFSTDRDTAAIPLGDTILFDVQLKAPGDTVILQLRLIGVSGGSTLEYSVSGTGFAQPWYKDDNFHEQQTTLGGETVLIKFKPDNDDTNQDRDITYIIHKTPIYTIDAADFQDPNVLNVMSYNVQFLPFGVTGLPQGAERGALMPAELSQYQDVIIFQEIFDDGPRVDNLIPALMAEGFTYITAELNPAASPISVPGNGGVMIASRWPVEFEDDWDFTKCGQAAQDCLAAKGIKYARIDKLGKKYHVFGTHMDAGSNADDIEAKNSQMGEMRDFIASQNIPSSEAVVFGGDFNVSPIAGNRLYLNFLDSIQPVLPNAIGYHNSTLDVNVGKIIDHVWGSSRHLIPLSATNEVITLRPTDDVLFDLGEFSDHRPVLGRFVYPDISASSNKAVHCPGDDMTLTISASNVVSYQWQKDGQDIQGATDSVYMLSNVSDSDEGDHQCVITYEQIFGDSGDTLNRFFFPNGPDTITANAVFDLGFREVDAILCLVGIEDVVSDDYLKLFPNPTSRKEVTLTWGEQNVNADLVLMHISGKEIMSDNANNANHYKLNTSYLQKGIYLIALTINANTYVRKLVVVD